MKLFEVTNDQSSLPADLGWIYPLKRNWITQLYPTLCNPWTVACLASLSMGFSRQEYWSGLPFPSPGDLPNSGIKPGSPALQADSLPTEPLGKSSENYPNFLHYSFLFFSCFMYIDAFRFSTEKLIQQIISSLITIESSNSAQLLGSQWINLLSIIIII